MITVFKTDRGRIRQHNEDNGGVFINQDAHLLAIVADGMGGHRAGDVASSMTIQLFEELWSQTSKMETAQEAEQWLQTHVQMVNNKLFAHSQEHVECEGMGTTLVAVIVTPLFSTIAHIGDSRCYMLNENGFQQLTEDHSLVNELVRSGQISREDAEHHPRKNVLLRALGTEQEVKMDIRTIMFEEGDLLLLCSDGLSNKVPATELARILEAPISIDEKASELVDQANQAGGEDNITLVILHHTGEEIRGEQPC